MSLIAVTAMSVLCAGLLQMSTHATREQSAGVDDLRALYLAEAGLAEAYNALAQGKDGAVGSADEPALYGSGVYWVEAEGLGNGLVALRSTGLCGSGRRTLELGVLLHLVSPGTLGAFGDEQVNLGNGAEVDWYDSSAGTYASQEGQGQNARVASNGGIALGAGAVVSGDCSPGAGFTVDLGEAASVAGSTSPSGDDSALPEVVLPEVEDSAGNLAIAGAQTIQNGALSFDALSVESGGTLTLAGPLDLVVDSLALASGASLVFDTTNGPVQLFVQGDAVLADGSTVSDSGGTPGDVSIYLLGDNLAEAVSEPETGGTRGASMTLGTVGFLATTAQRGDAEPVEPPVTYTAANSGEGWTEAWEDLGWDTEDDEPPCTVALGATGQLHALLYAPRSAVLLPATLRVFGAVAARQLTLAEGAKLTLDEQLLAGVGGGDFSLEIVAWSVQELPVGVPYVSSRLDPVSQLAALGIIPVDTALAHAQRAFEIDYVDFAGVTRSFFGVEEMFDWSAVDTVNAIAREGEAVTEAAPRTRGDVGTGTRTRSGNASWYAVTVPTRGG